MTTRAPGVRSAHPRVPQLAALTGVRFLAAAYVVCYHFLFPNLEMSLSMWRNLAGHGYSAVSFFFVLSGFVLSYNYLTPDNMPLDRYRFWLARFSRIYPAYVLGFLITAPYQIAGSLRVNALTVGAAKLSVGAGLYLTLLQAWTPWTAWYWNIPAWSLSVEAFFYLCFPFLAWGVSRVAPQHGLKWAALIWLVAIAVPSAYSYYRPVAGHYPLPMAQLAIETNPVLHLPQFLLGMVVGRMFTQGVRWQPTAASALSLAALALLLVTLALLPTTARTLISNGLTAPLSALLIFALAHQSGPLAAALSIAPLQILGEASYALYILQYPIAYVFGLSVQTLTPARFVSYCVGLIVVSVLSFYYAETPARKWLVWAASRPAPRPMPAVD